MAKSPYGNKIKPKTKVKLGYMSNHVPQPKPEKIEYMIQGKKASSNEYFIAQALNYFKLPYEFQVDYYGGRNLLGGMVIDFMVHTVPRATPVWVNGNYWHKGERKAIDLFQQLELDKLFHGQLNQSVEFWGIDSSTLESAINAVRREIMV